MKKTIFIIIILAIAALAIVSLGKPQNKSQVKKEVAKKETVIIKVDGSSTVYPITEAVAEEYQKQNAHVKVTVGIAGTGGGFKKFCNGETDISDASRPIKEKEVAACKEQGIEYIELPVAYDGLAVLVNPENTWAKEITVSELKMLWEPEAQKKITKWNQIRAEWPNEEIHLFGPGTDSGTFDYFTEKIVGAEGKSRGDYTASEDDNVLVQGIGADKYALGYFGVAYYEENKDKLKLVAVDDEKGKGAKLPEYENVVKGAYKPLSRPLFIYVATKALAKPEIESFLSYYVVNVGKLSKEVGYIALPDDTYTLVKERLEAKNVGSVFATDGAKGLTVKEVLEIK